ncbi:hypothetical protein AAVH_38501 [Aphelenchoides avenae]|nr:hypothetical protein AAVH_38501 [Aphelenchus avenae]
MGADVFSLAMFELDGDDMEADEATWIEKLQSIQRTVRAKHEGSTPSYTSIDPEDLHDESGALLHELL